MHPSHACIISAYLFEYFSEFVLNEAAVHEPADVRLCRLRLRPDASLASVSIDLSLPVSLCLDVLRDKDLSLASVQAHTPIHQAWCGPTLKLYSRRPQR